MGRCLRRRAGGPLGGGGASGPRAPRRLRLRLVASAGRRAALLGLVLVLAGACQMEVEVNVLVEEDGSGAVEVVVGLDEDALERVGGDLEAVMEVGDLLASGWRLDGPHLDPDGMTRVRLTHPYGTPEEATAVLGEVAAEDGPFRDLRVTRETSLAETSWSFDGRIDFSGGIEAFGDAGLAAELDGQPLGQSVAEIEEQLGEPLSQLLEVRVSVRLPGAVTSNATTPFESGAAWELGFGEGPVDLRAEGTERRTSVLVFGAVGGAALVALVVLVLVRVARRVPAGDDADAPAPPPPVAP